MSRRRLPPLADRVDHLVELARGRRVVHIGCANAPFTRDSIERGMLLHSQLASVTASLVGVDADEDALELLREHEPGEYLHVEGSLRDHLDEIPTCDLVVAGEVIEHVDDAGRFLADIRTLLVRDGSELVITTVNSYCALRVLQYAWPRRGPLVEPVHPDHVAYYSLTTLGLLCERAGLDVVDQRFYDVGAEHREVVPRRQLLANDLAVRWFPQLADGIIVRCRPATTSET